MLINLIVNVISIPHIDTLYDVCNLILFLYAARKVNDIQMLCFPLFYFIFYAILNLIFKAMLYHYFENSSYDVYTGEYLVQNDKTTIDTLIRATGTLETLRNNQVWSILMMLSIGTIGYCMGPLLIETITKIQDRVKRNAAAAT